MPFLLTCIHTQQNQYNSFTRKTNLLVKEKPESYK